MGADIDRPLLVGPIRSRTDPQLPGQGTTGVLPQVLITHNTEVVDGKLTPKDRFAINTKNPLVVTALPGIHQDRRSIRQLAQDQAVYGRITKIQHITRRIKPRDVRGRGIDLENRTT